MVHKLAQESDRLELNEILKRAMKYLIEGGAVAFAAHYIPNQKMKLEDVLMIGVTAAAVFAVLDMYAPEVASGARRGAGLGIGLSQVGYKA